jgi:CBS domain-containing protein
MTMSDFDQPLSSHMVAPVQTLLLHQSLEHAASLLEKLDVSALPVVDGSGRLTGVLERSDLLRVGRLLSRASEAEPRWSWPDLRVSECMQTSVQVAPPSQPLRLCARRMLDRRLNRVYVLDEDRLAGVLSTRELMLAVAGAGLDTPIGQLATGLAESIDARAPVSVASAYFAAGAGRPLVVLHGGTAVGVFALPELRAALEAEAGQETRLYMDRRVLSRPSACTTESVAREAAAARARYIIATDTPGYRVLSGLSFAACICGGGAALDVETRQAILPAPTVSRTDTGFDPGASHGPPPNPALARSEADGRRSPRAPTGAPPPDPRPKDAAPPRSRE